MTLDEFQWTAFYIVHICEFKHEATLGGAHGRVGQRSLGRALHKTAGACYRVSSDLGRAHVGVGQRGLGLALGGGGQVGGHVLKLAPRPVADPR